MARNKPCQFALEQVNSNCYYQKLDSISVQLTLKYCFENFQDCMIFEYLESMEYAQQYGTGLA